MDYNARQRAPVVVEAVGTAGVRRMLDIGGGSGAYSVAFAQAGPELQADILDVPAVVPIVRRHIEAAGLADRIQVREGDLHQPGYGDGYDLVFISAICHMLGPEENIDMLRKSCAALVADGRVAIQDFLLDRDKTSPRQAALFALNMLVGTDRGSSYSEDEYAAWLRAARFTGVRRVRLPGPTGLMIATRPAT
jgi:predicted O-methyltransferase YrrM